MIRRATLAGCAVMGMTGAWLALGEFGLGIAMIFVAVGVGLEVLENW